MAAAGIIDPTKVGKYPVVLSDALLGKRSSEVYTGIRYNHRPDPAPDSAKLRQNVTFKGNFDMLYGDKGNIHKYRGNRTSNENQYVLIFDPNREVFVLHKVDSTFNMNLIQTPDNKNADNLKKQYPHLPNSTAESSTTKTKAKAGGGAKGTKAQKAAPPKPSKPAAPEKRKNGSDDEEDSDDGDVLEIDFGDTAAPNRDFSPAFPPRRFSEFAAQNEEEEDDADGEDEDEEMSEQEHFPLPSPIVHQSSVPEVETVPNNTISLTFDDDSASEEDEEPAPAPAPVQEQQEQDDDDDMEDDLEAALEAELAGADSESDVSEED
ncbi:hypothetical protein E8E14_013761 [Neopestalotiopsis sp. 37M]|nr:hypothetical protein E8E14_013761 [Neopestalotiopsis sp. 37M]